jgi:hypothetical protein
MTDEQCTALIETTMAHWRKLDAEGLPRLHAARRRDETDSSYAVRLVRLYQIEKARAA